MSERLPSGDLPDTIAWTLYENRHAVGSTYGVQTVGALRLQTPFSVYCDEHKEMVAKVIPKEHAPAIVHGHSRDNLRSQDCLESISCLALDCDGYGQIPYSIMHDLSDSGLAAMIQVRQTKIGNDSVFKFHVVLPLSEPIVIDDVLTPTVIRKRNLSVIQFLEHRWKCVFDRATASPIHLLHPYTKRAVTDELPTTIVLNGNGLGMRQLLRQVGFQEEPSPTFFLNDRKKTATRREVNAQGNSMLQALRDANLVLAPKGDAFLIECPCGHDAKSKTKTIYYPTTSKIVCFAERCSGRPLSWFIRHMEPEHQATALAGASAILRAALLNACSPKIDQPTAQNRIVDALRSVRPADRKALIIRVTTGAGKSFATAQHLSAYSAAHKDPDDPDSLIPGKHAIFATPTNQLLREIKQRITIPHVQRTGVLAVLRDDGNAACHKFDIASKLQKAGGDVHRLLCAKCSYKDGCEAIAGAKVGQGALTLTNHALLPTVAKEQHENGGFPLIVWDETPQMVTTTEIKYDDIVWLRDQFDIDSSPIKNAITAMIDPVVFGDKYRIAMRPMLDLVSRLIEAQGTGVLDMEKEAQEWKRPHHSDSVLGRAEAMTQIENTSGTTWERIRRVTTQAKRANSAEVAFDVMRPASQMRILRAETVLRALHDLAGADTASVHRTLNGLYLTCVTQNGVVWRDHGGVILDATAPLAVLKRLRPDAEVVDLRVQDSGEVERLVVYDSNVSRTAWTRLSRDPERAQHEAKRLARRIRSYLKQAEKRLDRKPKAVVFTYKDSLPGNATSWARLSGLADEVDWHYYGNTRGYDRWFQEGFDVFITVGDPVANIGALAASWSLLNGEQSEEAFHTFVAESAENESAQAHGRSRDPQRKKSDGYRLHVHFGTRIPLGWDFDTASVEPPES